MSTSILNVLSLPGTLANGPGVLSLTLIHDDQDAILFDAGLNGMAAAIQEAMAAAGVHFARLTHIAITHSDTDHIGSIAALRAAAPGHIEVVCHEEEKKYVECDVPPIRMTQMEKSLDTMPEAQRAIMAPLFQSLKENYWRFKATVDRTVTDGDTLPCGVEAIFTPGHTPGHLCYYHRPSRALVAGDAMNVENGQLVGAPVFTMFDRPAWRLSMEKLMGYDIETVVCYHGGVWTGDVRQRMKEIIGA